MATGEVPAVAPSGGGFARSSADGDDDALLLYLYEKSSQPRAKCYDCISMGGLVPQSPADGSDEVAAGDRELLSRSTDQICTKALFLATGHELE